MNISHAVVLAGGLGTRIRSELGDTPKALAPIGDRVFIEYKIEELLRNGCSSAHFLVGFGAQELRQTISMGHYALDMSFVDDGPVPLGTGGALHNVLPELPNDFYVTYGDSLLELEYSLLDGARRSLTVPCSLAVTGVHGPADRLNTCVDQGIVTRHDKCASREMNCTDYGVMLFHKASLMEVTKSWMAPFDLSSVVSELARRRLLGALATELPYWEIGTPETLRRVRQHIVKHHSQG